MTTMTEINKQHIGMLKAVLAALPQTFRDCAAVDDENSLILTAWGIATWFLPQFERFPILAIYGPTDTGKTTILKVLERFSFQPQFIAARGKTLPVLRDNLADTYNTTVLVDEADECASNEDFEQLLGLRYDGATAKVAYKKSFGRDWHTEESDIFGATALHRRHAYVDPALEGRTIKVMTRRGKDRTFPPISSQDDIFSGCTMLLNDSTNIKMPDVPSPPKVVGKVLDTFQPLLAIASVTEDETLQSIIIDRMVNLSEQMAEAQSLEPNAMILRGLIQCLAGEGDRLESKSIKVYEGIGRQIENSFGKRMNPWQLSQGLKSMKFKVYPSGGVNRVYPSIAEIVRAARQIGYEDDILNQYENEVS